MIEEKGLISIKTLVMKNPNARAKSEEQFLQLFLKIKHSKIFLDFPKEALELFVKKLQVQVYKPGDIIVKKGENWQQMIFIMEGVLETTDLVFADDR